MEAFDHLFAHGVFLSADINPENHVPTARPKIAHTAQIEISFGRSSISKKILVTEIILASI
jgi:hypothetical protein